MPFSSLTDPAEPAWAGAAVDAAWSKIKHRLPAPVDERERTRFAYSVASLVSIADDEDDLAQRALSDPPHNLNCGAPGWCDRENCGDGTGPRVRVLASARFAQRRRMRHPSRGPSDMPNRRIAPSRGSSLIVRLYVGYVK